MSFYLRGVAGASCFLLEIDTACLYLMSWLQQYDAASSGNGRVKHLNVWIAEPA